MTRTWARVAHTRSRVGHTSDSLLGSPGPRPGDQVCRGPAGDQVLGRLARNKAGHHLRKIVHMRRKIFQSQQKYITLVPGGGAGQGTQPGGSCLTTLPALVGGTEGAGVLLGAS